MERNLENLYDLHFELKEHVNKSCERRAEKTDLEKHVDKNDDKVARVTLSVASTNKRVDDSNTVLNNRISSLLFKAISAFVFTFIVMAGVSKWLYGEIDAKNDLEASKQDAMQATLHSIDKTVSMMSVKVNYNSQDLSEIKDKIRKDTK